MTKIFILLCLLVNLAVADEENLFAFSSIIVDEDIISAGNVIFAFSNVGQKKNAQHIGVGWYEHSLITGNLVEFVSQDIQGKIDERKKSTASPKDICDLYGIVFNDKGMEIPEPAFASALYSTKNKNKTDEVVGVDFQKQDYARLLEKLKSAKYYKLDVAEPGFIQLQVEGKPTNIIFAKKDKVVVYFRILFGSAAFDYILLDKTKALNDIFKVINR